MIARQTIYYFLTLSLVLHLGAAVVWLEDLARPSARQLPLKTMQVHLVVMPAPAPSAPPEPPRKAEPPRRTEPAKRPVPVERPKPRPVAKKPRPRKKTRPEPRRLAAAPAATSRVVRQQDVAPVIDEAQRRDRYLAKLLAHVDKHKYYPRVARRRGLEGVIRVSFRVLPGGLVSQLQVAGDNRILCEAARQTVRASLPLPLPPEGVSLPLSVSFGMQYRLN